MRLENKKIEYTTKKGNTLVFYYRVEWMAGEGASALYGQVYRSMDILDPDYENIVEDEEIAAVLSIARDEGDEALEDYIKSKKPKQYRVDINRTYRCRYLAEFDIEAESEEEALDKANDLARREFKNQEVFSDIDYVDGGDSIELVL